MRVAASRAGSWVEGRGFRKVIGGKRWELGKDEQRATALALQIESLWLQSGGIWTPEALQTAEGAKTALLKGNAPECKPAAPVAVAVVVKPKALSFNQSIDRYREAMKQSASLALPTKHAICSRTRMLERSPLASMPIEAIGAEQLSQLVNHYLNRPKAKRTNEPISPTSAKLMVKTARAVFDWLDLNGLWNAPKRFDRFFRIPRNLCPAPVVETYSLDELKAIYKHSNERQRLYILLALNCGFCSMEIASLKRSEIDLKGKSIKRKRQKTQVECQWTLWQETADLLKRHMATAGEYALTNEQGLPLIRYSNGGKTRADNLKDGWRNMQKRAGVSKAFKLLRKTGATMIRAIGGIEVSETYLAHSEQSMAKHYSKPDPAKLTAALVELRQQLQPMLDVAKASPVAASKQ